MTNIILFLRIAGIPPLLGFIPKIITVILIIKRNIIITTLLILINNTFSTFFYIRISLNNLLINFNIKKTLKPKKKIRLPFYLIFRPIFLIITWNFKLIKLLIFKIKIKKN